MSEIKISLRTGTSTRRPTYRESENYYEPEPDIQLHFIYTNNSPETKNNDIKKFLNLNPVKCIENTGECSICQSDLESGQKMSKLDCSHSFHYRCLKEWTRYKSTCPLCRNTIPILER